MNERYEDEFGLLSDIDKFNRKAEENRRLIVQMASVGASARYYDRGDWQKLVFYGPEGRVTFKTYARMTTKGKNPRRKEPTT